jgi:hypothetical protein
MCATNIGLCGCLGIRKCRRMTSKAWTSRASGIADELADLHYITDETRVGSVPSTCNARLRSTDMELDVAPVHPDVSVVAVVGGSAFQTRSGRSAGYGPQQVHQALLSVSLTINAAQQNDLAICHTICGRGAKATSIP